MTVSDADPICSEAQWYSLCGDLSKVVFSLSYNIESLLKNVICCNHTADILESKNALKIQVVEKEDKQVTFIVSDAIIRHALTRLDITDNIVDEVAPVILGIYPGNKSCFDGVKYTFTSGMHCEALLLKYHPNFPPLSYIGVFQIILLCLLHPFPCSRCFWSGGQKILHKGIIKVSPHWSIPSGFGDDKDKVVRSRLMKYFQDDLKRFLKTQDKMRSGSNNTNTSAASQDVTTPPESVENARNFSRNIIQETKTMR